MGALATVIIRPGVEFTPDAAAAFRRAEARVQKEFNRNIDVNSTYRSWDQQLKMYNAWNAYVAGRGPYPGHSKAVHPSESFHVSGLALDSDDWTVPRILEILAENGFIRNRLYVPNENHHFEYIRAQDKNYGKPVNSGGAAKPAEPKEPTLEDLMALKNVTIATEASKGKFNSTTLDFADGMKATLNNTDEVYTTTTAKYLTGQGALKITKGHYEQLLKEFDAHFKQKREHELAVARASAGK